jgi:hypothetical protein
MLCLLYGPREDVQHSYTFEKEGRDVSTKHPKATIIAASCAVMEGPSSTHKMKVGTCVHAISPAEGQQLARHLHITVSQGFGGPEARLAAVAHAYASRDNH